jgi:glutaredoxin
MNTNTWGFVLIGIVLLCIGIPLLVRFYRSRGGAKATEPNWDPISKASDNGALIFYTSPTCPACIKLKQTMTSQKWIQQLKIKFPSLGVQNVTISPQVAKQNNIQYVPTIRLGGTDYQGARTLPELEKWIESVQNTQV